jgi:hypothetical protein
MGPTFLRQVVPSVTFDESVFFGPFYTVVCPMFFVETLPSPKVVGAGHRQAGSRHRGQGPEMNCAPNFPFSTAKSAGQRRHNGWQSFAEGRPVKGDAAGVTFDPAPEAEALRRWHNRDFLEVERGS